MISRLPGRPEQFALLLLVFLAGCSDPGSPKISKVLDKPLEIPARKAYLNDFSSLLTPSDRERIDSELSSLDEELGVDFVIVISESTGGYSIEDHSMEIARQWCLECRSNSNGEILLDILRKDQQFRFNVSKPLWGRLSGEKAEELQKALEDSFSQGRSAEGLTQLVASVRAVLEKR